MTGRYIVVVSVCLAALILPLSFSGAAMATPAISRDMGGNLIEITWIVNAFMLTFGSFLMAAGAIADEFGRKRVFTWGVGLFSIVSLALGLAPNIWIFDLLRGLQGIAAAAALSGGTAALAQEFEGHARTRVFSLLGTTFGVGLAFGPVIAGIIIETLGWRSVFLASTVVGLTALVIGMPRMRESRDPNAKGLDWPGTVAFTLGLSLFTFAVIQAPENGWLGLQTLILFGLSFLSLIIFVAIELAVRRPMLDLSLFRYPRFVGVQFLPIATCYCYIVLLVLLPLRFINAEHYREMGAGLLMIALSGPMLFVPFWAATLTRWFSAGTISGIGLLIAAGGLIWLSIIPFGANGYVLALPMLVIGFGTGMPWGLMDGLSVSVVPKERAGMATGIFSTTRIAGEGIALAIVTAILAAFTHNALQHVAVTDSVMLNQGIQAASQRLAIGDIHAASASLPGVAQRQLVDLYARAFQNVLWLLSGITMLSSLIVFGLLSRSEESQSGAHEQLGRGGSRSMEEVS